MLATLFGVSGVLAAFPGGFRQNIFEGGGAPQGFFRGPRKVFSGVPATRFRSSQLAWGRPSSEFPGEVVKFRDVYPENHFKFSGGSTADFQSYMRQASG